MSVKLVLTLSWRRPLSYRNRSTDLRSKSMDWFLYDNGLRHERVKWLNPFLVTVPILYPPEKTRISITGHKLVNVITDKIKKQTFYSTFSNNYLLGGVCQNWKTTILEWIHFNTSSTHSGVNKSIPSLLISISSWCKWDIRLFKAFTRNHRGKYQAVGINQHLQSLTWKTNANIVKNATISGFH